MITEFESLKAYNTFGVSAQARYFATFQTIEELRELLQNSTVRNNQRLILGGGSNMLFTRNFDGIVLKNELMGIEKISEDEHHYFVKSAAGEVWVRGRQSNAKHWGLWSGNKRRFSLA
jgi:UDP-N-acetylmuramate dehydrogenase